MKKSLRDLELEVGYTTFDNDTYNEFIIPCLRNAKQYNRFSGYFSSKIFIYLLEGIKDFVKNKGVINLVLGCLPPKEFDIINATKEELEELYVNKLIMDIENVVKESTKDHAILLAWLLYHGHLKIKYAIINLESKKDENMINSPGFLHSKLGLFYDEDGNGISYIGSPNYTLQAYAYNFEDFDVFNNWEDQTNIKHFKRHEKNFNEFWSNSKDLFVVVELPENQLKNNLKEPLEMNDLVFDNVDLFNKKLRESILNNIRQQLETKNKVESMKKIDTTDLSIDNEDTLIKDITKVEWRKPQLEGYQKWIENEKKGILEIATGVGKTLIAIKAIYDFLTEKNKSSKRKIVTLVLPDNLIDQWEDDLKDWLVDENGNSLSKILSINTDSSKRKSVPKLLQKLKDDFIMLDKPLVILAYYNTFSSKIIPILNGFKNTDVFLIADEVHELGTKTRQKRFKNFIPNYLLGLSATPYRYFDDEGTKFITDYFENGIIYEYEISDGIQDGYLCPYKYYPLFCSLNAKEEKKYEKSTKRINFLKTQLKNEKNREKKKEMKKEYEEALFYRKRIIKKAASKLPIVIDLLSDIKENDQLKYILIYNEDDDQLGKLYDSLINSDYSVTKITRHELMSDRKKSISHIKSGMRQILLAEKILDQGIDIQNLKYGIIISSTGNIRQHIQRRGRLLRISKVKEFSIIYDLVVGEIGSEQKRVFTFYDDCMNKNEVIEICLDNNLDFEKIEGEDLAERN